MDRFGELIFDLGEEMQIPLRVDHNNACLLEIDETLAIQMQMDSSGETLLFVAEIGPVPPGNYRQNVLFEALRSNSQHEINGYLTFIAKSGMLMLCDQMPSEGMVCAGVIERLQTLHARGKKWKDAIEQGQIAPQEELRRAGPAGASGPMFGIK